MRFPEWFRTSVAMVYAEKIPTTIEYLCRVLEVNDPWVDSIIEHLRHKQVIMDKMSQS